MVGVNPNLLAVYKSAAITDKGAFINYVIMPGRGSVQSMQKGKGLQHFQNIKQGLNGNFKSSFPHMPQNRIERKSLNRQANPPNKRLHTL